MAQTFDTLGAAHKLEAAGIGREQAEAIAETVRRGHGDITWLKWVIGTLAGICLATLTGTLFTAFQVVDLAARLAP